MDAVSVGGHDAFADPQSAWLSPLGILVLLFDFPIGTRLFLASCTALGAVGAIKLCRQLGMSVFGGLLVVITGFLSMPQGLYAAGGIPGFSLGLAVLPWLIFCIQSGSNRSVVGAGFLLALTLYSGGPNQFVWHSLFLLGLGVCLSVMQKRQGPFRSVVLTGIAAAIFGAAKMIPMWLMSLDQSRLTAEEQVKGVTFRLAYHAWLHPYPPFMENPQGEFVGLLRSGDLVSLNQLNPARLPEVVPGTRGDWVNYGCYVGWIVVLLAIVGAVVLVSKTQASDPTERVDPWLRDRQTRNVSILALTMVGLFFFWLSFGSNATPSLWEWLHQLPVISSMSSPIRLLIYLLLPISLFASTGLEWIGRVARARLDPTYANVLLGIILGLVFLDVHLPTRHLYSVAFCEPRLDFPGDSSEFITHRWDGRQPSTTLYDAPVTPAVRAKQGLVNGYGIFHQETSVKDSADELYRGEAFLLDSNVGKIRDVRIGARTVSFSYNASSDSIVVINQNWYRGWAAMLPLEAEAVRHDDGRLAIRIPKGSGEVQLRYTPPGLVAGMLVSLFAMPVFIGGLWWTRSSRATPNHAA